MIDRATIDQLLPQKYHLHSFTSVTEERVYYETHDWLLYGKSLCLYRCGDRYVLQSLSDAYQTTTVESPHIARFASDLPDCELRSRIQAVAAVRALLPIASIVVQSHSARVLNEDEKTVVRLELVNVLQSDNGLVIQPESQSTQAEMTRPAVIVVVHRLRGYDKEAKQIAKALSALPNVVENQVGDERAIYDAATLIARRTPGDYTSKLNLQLKPEMWSVDAAKLILRRLLEIIQANEDGIRKDVDVEFLHDYRVAIRRARSLLSQLKKVFPQDVTERFKQDLRDLAQPTNALRDLDVYLMAESSYRAMLPNALKTDIAPLFDLLRSSRAEALEQVIDALDSTDTAEIMARWEAIVREDGGATYGAMNAAVPVYVFSQQRIYRRYAAILKKGQNLLKDAEDEMLHQLRIDCKKLRYLLEFFASLYPEEELQRLITELRRLQDNLGEFNDLSVQQTYLVDAVSRLPESAPSTLSAINATSVLVEILANKQAEVKGEFADRFTAFASKRNQALYRDLFTVSATYTDSS